MSFLSVLKSIGHVVTGVAATATAFSPAIGAVPVAGPIAVTILGAITAAEGLITTASQGAAKKAVVTAVVNAQHTDVNQTQLSATIDAIVAAMNALQASLAGAPVAPAVAPTAAKV